MKSWYAKISSFVTIVCMVLLVGTAQAQQNTADIVGTVTDSTGAVVPNAKVTITNTGTNVSQSVISTGSGDYTFTQLQVGAYSEKVEAMGFKAFSVPNFTLAAGDRARVDAKMEVGDVTQTVEVQGAVAPALETDSSTVSNLVTQQAVEDVPLNGRNFVKLVQLTAGVTQGTPGQINSGSRPDDRRATSDFSANGQGELENNNMIDGLDNNERLQGVIGVRPSVDAIQEINVETNMYTAEVGRTGGAVVNLVTKSGTNGFHGTGYEFFRNKVLNANPNYQFPSNASGGLTALLPNPPFRQNQYGGSIGGPIKKDKTFFFGDYEGLARASGLVVNGLTVPTLCERGSALAALQAPYDAKSIYSGGAVSCPDGTSPTLPGDFSDVNSISPPGGGAPCVQNGTTCPYVVIPQAKLNNLGLAYFSLFPLPTSAGTTGNFNAAPLDTQNSRTFDVRIDQHISDKDTLFARYSYNNVHTITPDAFPTIKIDPSSGLPTAPSGSGVLVAPGAVPFGGANGFAGPSFEQQQGWAASYAHVFGPSLVLDLKAQYLRSSIRSLPLGSTNNVGTALGFPCTATSCINIPGAPFLPEVTLASAQGGSAVPNYTGFTDTFYIPELNFDNTFQYAGVVNWEKGSHSIKIGLGFIRRQGSPIQSQSPDGRFNFTGIYTGTPGGDLLEGYSVGNSGGFSHLRANSLTSPQMRTWEPSAYLQDDWRAKHWLTLNLGLRYDIFTPYTEKNGQISNYDQATGLIVSPAFPGSQRSNRTADINTDYRDLAPRIGFAASLPHSTVLRGGFGITFFPTNYTSNYFLKNAPFNYTLDCLTQNVSNSNPACPAGFANNVIANYGQAPLPNSSSQVGESGGISLSAGLPIPSLNVNQVIAPSNCTFDTNADYSTSGKGSNGLIDPATCPNNPYTGSTTQAVPHSMPAAYLEQFSLQLQKQFGQNVFSVGYVGELGHHVARSLNINALSNPQQLGVAPLAVQFPVLAKASISENGDYASSAYNALQLNFVRRFSHGLTVNANYVWAHNMDNTGGLCQPNVGTANYCLYDNPANLAGPGVKIYSFSQGYAWGNNGLDTPNRIAGTINYELPFGKMATGVEGALIKGWSVNAGGSWQSGLPFTVSSSVTEGASPSGGLDQTCSGKSANPTLLAWFNASCFKLPTPGQYGDIHPDQLFGPHQRNLDFSLFKEFPLTERFRMQFRTEVFNLFNTPNFGTPSNTTIQYGSCPVTTTQCVGVNAYPTGVIQSLNSNQASREIQFALKLLF